MGTKRGVWHLLALEWLDGAGRLHCWMVGGADHGLFCLDEGWKATNLYTSSLMEVVL